MADLPTGTVTFLFTDIEGSTQMLQHLGERYADVLTTQRALLRAAFGQHGSHEVDTRATPSSLSSPAPSRTRPPLRRYGPRAGR